MIGGTVAGDIKVLFLWFCFIECCISCYCGMRCLVGDYMVCCVEIYCGGRCHAISVILGELA